jgi:hypothetical protein
MVSAMLSALAESTGMRKDLLTVKELVADLRLNSKGAQQKRPRTVTQGLGIYKQAVLQSSFWFNGRRDKGW